MLKTVNFKYKKGVSAYLLQHLRLSSYTNRIIYNV
jgi:hypothetical protein